LEKKKGHQWDGMIFFFFQFFFLVLHHWQASQEGFSIKWQHNTKKTFFKNYNHASIWPFKSNKPNPKPFTPLTT
jgi:hypothetical protein